MRFVEEPNYGKALRLSLMPEDVERAAGALEAKDARIAELEGDFGLVRNELIAAWAEDETESTYEAARARAEGRFNKMLGVFREATRAASARGKP